VGVIRTLSRIFTGESLYTFDEFFDKFLGRPTPAERNRLYQALFDAKTRRLLHAASEHEEFIVDSRDNFMARELFVSGSSQLDRLTQALDLIKQERSIDPARKTLVDIGANIGVICIPAVARGLCARAVAVEPNPSVCKLLRANVALNGLEKRIDVYETALADADGAAEMEISEDNSGDNRVFVASSENAFNERARDKIAIATARFDKLFGALNLDDCIIWMDVQGYEGKVLSGAKNILTAKPPLVSEFWPYGMRRAQTYELLRDALSHYSKFCVLGGEEHWLAMSNLDSVRDSIHGVDHVDILAV
jgi:FkbM family methyltransferase